MKLTDIILEIDSSKFDLNDLNLVDDALKKALEDASKEAPTNEMIGTALVALAIPGLLKLFIEIVEKIARGTGVNLKKFNPKWLQVVKDIANRLDDYVDTPIRTVLKPFIKEEDKRNKLARIIKAALLVLAAGNPSLGNIDQATEITKAIEDLTPELAQELIRIMNQKTNVFVNLKEVLVKYVKIL